jgi:Sec-independent protein secretion pathway component TatC
MPLPRTSFVFWFMMQIAMACGFLAALPVNVLLIKAGIKKGM